jgi:hypothetical protein
MYIQDELEGCMLDSYAGCALCFVEAIPRIKPYDRNPLADMFYLGVILELSCISRTRKMHSYFMQDNGTAHTTKFSMTAIEMYSTNS